MLPTLITIWDNGKTRVFRVQHLVGTHVISKEDLAHSILDTRSLVEVKRRFLAHTGTLCLLEYVEEDVSPEGDIILRLSLPFLIEE